MDEPLLVILGKNRDYRILEADRQKIMQVISDKHGVIGDPGTFLEGLVATESLPAAGLNHLGGPTHVSERGEALPDAMMNLFRLAKNYANKYGAACALLYNLDLTKTREVSADVQLLIKT